MNLTEPLPVVYTAQSKHFFYCRDAVCVYVLSKGCIPLNPFRIFDYFLNDRVDRDLVRRANFNLIRKSDELWVFGDTIANGVLAEIKCAFQLGKHIRFFTVSAGPDEIRELHPEELEQLKTESELDAELRADEFQKYIGLVQQWLQTSGHRG